MFVASLGGAQRAAGFAMMSSALRRAGASGVTGAKKGMVAFLGGAATLPSSSLPRSRWTSTLMLATAQGGPSLSVQKKRESAAHPAYDVVEEDFVAEYGATTTLYKHKKSGAEVLSVQIDDDNKVNVAAHLDCGLALAVGCGFWFWSIVLGCALTLPNVCHPSMI